MSQHHHNENPEAGFDRKMNTLKTETNDIARTEHQVDVRGDKIEVRAHNAGLPSVQKIYEYIKHAYEKNVESGNEVDANKLREQMGIEAKDDDGDGEIEAGQAEDTTIEQPPEESDDIEKIHFHLRKIARVIAKTLRANQESVAVVESVDSINHDNRRYFGEVGDLNFIVTNPAIGKKIASEISTYTKAFSKDIDFSTAERGFKMESTAIDFSMLFMYKYTDSEMAAIEAGEAAPDEEETASETAEHELGTTSTVENADGGEGAVIDLNATRVKRAAAEQQSMPQELFNTDVKDANERKAA